MIALIQTIQVLSGILWLLPALWLSSRIPAAFRPEATRFTAIHARNAFVSWLMVGYVLRWIAWPTAIAAMDRVELLAWGALYTLSCVCALWFLRDALATGRGR